MPMSLSVSFMDMFRIVIQLGAILAVVLIFWKQIWPFGYDKKVVIKKDIFVMWFKIVVACIPAVIVELIFGDKIDAVLYNYKVVSVMLILVGVVFIVVENWNRNRTAKITTVAQLTYRTAFYIGMFQVIAAVFPGTSRSGATIIGGLLLGVSRTVAAEFTFYLAIPVMFGASLVKMKDFGLAFSGTELSVLLVGTVVSFVVSIFVIKFLMGYIKKHDFKVFGWYRIVLGILCLIIMSRM